MAMFRNIHTEILLKSESLPNIASCFGKPQEKKFFLVALPPPPWPGH